jgi:hypothetical protein
MADKADMADEGRGRSTPSFAELLMEEEQR